MSARCATVLATFVARGSNTDIVQALRLSAVNSVNQTGQQVVRRNLNIQPMLTIRPGSPRGIDRAGGGRRCSEPCEEPSPAASGKVRRRSRRYLRIRSWRSAIGGR
jgi:hypothetical protein